MASATQFQRAATTAGRGPTVSKSARGSNTRVIQPRRGVPSASGGRFNI